MQKFQHGEIVQHLHPEHPGGYQDFQTEPKILNVKDYS